MDIYVHEGCRKMFGDCNAHNQRNGLLARFGCRLLIEPKLILPLIALLDTTTVVPFPQCITLPFPCFMHDIIMLFLPLFFALGLGSQVCRVLFLLGSFLVVQFIADFRPCCRIMSCRCIIGDVAFIDFFISVFILRLIVKLTFPNVRLYQ